MRREDQNVIPLHLPQHILHLQSDNHIEGSKRLIQQNNRRLRQQEQQHLQLILHPVGVVFDQPVPVLGGHAHHIKIMVNPLLRL
ncbi:hypothetical protein D3C81_1888520 [compost metagenome]